MNSTHKRFAGAAELRLFGNMRFFMATPFPLATCPTTHMIAQTIADELRRTAAELSSEEPYAFTLIQGQLCNYLGYADATVGSADGNNCQVHRERLSLSRTPQIG